MWLILKNTVLKPALQRLLPIGATALVAGGDWLCQNLNACGLVTIGGANAVMAYVVAVALLIADLVIEAVSRRRLRDGAKAEVMKAFERGGW